MESPVIIGVARTLPCTLYFKSIWPDAKVTAIEPNPHTREYLQHNLEQNQIEDVTIVPVALSNQTGRDTLYIDTSADEWNYNASFFPATWTNTRPGEPITVDTEPLAKFLQQPVDILKLDVEGAEAKVLFAAGAALRQVRHLFVEFHGRPGHSLPNLLTFLEEQGFTCRSGKTASDRTKSGRRPGDHRRPRQ